MGRWAVLGRCSYVAQRFDIGGREANRAEVGLTREKKQRVFWEVVWMSGGGEAGEVGKRGELGSWVGGGMWGGEGNLGGDQQ